MRRMEDEGGKMKKTSQKTKRAHTVSSLQSPIAPSIRGGDPTLAPKRVTDSQMRLAVLMNPEQANSLGDVHGGEIMKLVDEAGALAAMKHARQIVVTVAMDSMKFLSPVHVGDLVTLNASVNYIGRTSMEVGIRVHAENVVTGQVTHTNSAYAVYVAVDRAGRTTPVPPLILETDEERRRWDEGAARQQYRLAQANKK